MGMVQTFFRNWVRNAFARPMYSQNYYRIVKEKNRTYYEVYSLPRTETPPEDYNQVSFVCLRPDGA